MNARTTCPAYRRILIKPSCVFGELLTGGTWQSCMLIKRGSVSSLTKVKRLDLVKLLKMMESAAPLKFPSFASIMGESNPEFDIYPLSPTPWLDWLWAQCAGGWLLVDRFNLEGGDRIYFEQDADRVLFELCWPQLKK